MFYSFEGLQTNDHSHTNSHTLTNFIEWLQSYKQNFILNIEIQNYWRTTITNSNIDRFLYLNKNHWNTSKKSNTIFDQTKTWTTMRYWRLMDFRHFLRYHCIFQFVYHFSYKKDKTSHTTKNTHTDIVVFMAYNTHRGYFSTYFIWNTFKYV